MWICKKKREADILSPVVFPEASHLETGKDGFIHPLLYWVIYPREFSV